LDINGSVLATALISPTNSSRRDRSYFQSIGPIPLTAGQTYYLQGGFPARADNFDIELWICNWCNPSFSLAPELHFAGFAVGTNGLGLFPAMVFTPTFLVSGPNFEFNGKAAVVPSAILSGGQWAPPNHFQFVVNGVAGQNYTIQASTNLFDWFPIKTTNAPGDSFTVVDNTSTCCRFYRALAGP